MEGKNRQALGDITNRAAMGGGGGASAKVSRRIGIAREPSIDAFEPALLQGRFSSKLGPIGFQQQAFSDPSLIDNLRLSGEV